MDIFKDKICITYAELKLLRDANERLYEIIKTLEEILNEPISMARQAICDSRNIMYVIEKKYHYFVDEKQLQENEYRTLIDRLRVYKIKKRCQRRLTPTKYMINKIMKDVDYNVRIAARRMKIHETTLRKWMRRYNILGQAYMKKYEPKWKGTIEYELKQIKRDKGIS